MSTTPPAARERIVYELKRELEGETDDVERGRLVLLIVEAPEHFVREEAVEASYRTLVQDLRKRVAAAAK